MYSKNISSLDFIITHYNSVQYSNRWKYNLWEIWNSRIKRNKFGVNAVKKKNKKTLRSWKSGLIRFSTNFLWMKSMNRIKYLFSFQQNFDHSLGDLTTFKKHQTEHPAVISKQITKKVPHCRFKIKNINVNLVSDLNKIRLGALYYAVQNLQNRDPFF